MKKTRSRAPITIVHCLQCDNGIEKRISDVERSKTKRFFCQDCAKTAPRKIRRGIKTICAASDCNNEIYNKPSETKKYCSAACAAKKRIVERSKKICEKCGEPFLVRKKENRKYCSAICAGVETLDRIKIQCGLPECGKIFEIRSSEIEYRKFCSRDCFYKDQTANATGHIAKDGYKTISVQGQSIREHIHVMELFLGRKLYPGENVHHKNGVRHDNKLENLELWVSSQPSGQRPEDLLEWAREIIRRYG